MSTDVSEDTVPAVDDYFSTPPGLGHLSNMAIRLRDMSAVLAEHGLQDAAERITAAYGCILGHLAASNQNGQPR